MNSIPAIEQVAGRGAARAAARKHGRKVGGYDRRPRLLNYILLGLVVVIGLLPLYYTLVIGSSDTVSIAQKPLPQWYPDASLFTNFKNVINAQSFDFWQAVWNSVIIAVVVSASTVILSTLAGFAFAKLRFPGRKGLLVFVIATMAIPTQLGVVPLYIIMSKLEWIGHLQAVIVPSLVGAFGVFWMTQYLEEALPYELIEAARVDGASMFRTFWSIAMPAARPAAAMLALFTFVAQWVNFFWPSIVLNNQNPTLPLAIRLLQQNYFVDYSLIMAGVFLMTLPLLILFAFAGRQLVAGIMAGAVKG